MSYSTEVRVAGWSALAVLAATLPLAGCGAVASSPASGVETKSSVRPPLIADQDGDLQRPTGAENLAHLLFYAQSLDRLRKTGYQKSLKIRDEQNTRIEELASALDTLNAEAQAAPAEKSHEFKPKYNELVARIDRELRQILSDSQFDESRVIVLEAQIGSTAFLMPGVPETLKLSNGQIREISALIEAHEEELQPRNFTFWNLRKVIALGRELRAKAELLLTDDQKDTWARLTAGGVEIDD